MTPSRVVASRTIAVSGSKAAQARLIASAAAAGMMPSAASARGQRLLEIIHFLEFGLGRELQQEAVVAEEAGEKRVVKGRSGHRLLQMSKKTVSLRTLQVDVEAVGVA